MVPVVSRKKKFKPDEVVKCHESVGGLDESGAAIAVTRGMVVRASHPLVVRNPSCFIDAGTPDDELPAASESIGALPVPAWHRDAEPELPDDQVAVARQGFEVTVNGLYRHIVEGQRVDRNDQVVRDHPELFEEPARPLKAS
jgi:hypothetical protein